MKVETLPHELRELTRQWRMRGESIGFVPTMGALHEGHIELVRAARAGNDKVVASIFVNPTQFRPGEDFASYPRPLERDSALLAAAGCDVLFAPSAGAMYPRMPARHDGQAGARGAGTWVEAGALGSKWEGAARPGHFRGVTTVVAKLFNIVGPCHAYFGEKDYQQLRVLQSMAHDLFFDVEVVPCPTVREADGLAMSSRNANLDAPQRAAAAVLFAALQAGAALAAAGQGDAERLCAQMREVVATQPLVALQYLAVVNSETLEPLNHLRPTVDARAILAANLGTTRLIDNTPLG